jgi:hypothetical protein
MTKGYDLQRVCVLCGAHHHCADTSCLRNYPYAPANYRLCACGFKHDPGSTRCPNLGGGAPLWNDGPPSSGSPAARRGTIYDALLAESKREALAIPPRPATAMPVSNESEAALQIISAGLMQSTGLWSHNLIPGCYYASRHRALAEAFKVYSDGMS